MTPKLPSTESFSLYNQDYYLWLEKTTQLIRNGKLSELDLSNLAEEIEDMGKREKRALESNLVVILVHLLKYKYQSGKRTNSWKSTIREHRRRLNRIFKDSPSLKRYFDEVFAECYQEAREQAADQTELPLNTFPKDFPFTPEEAVNSHYLPQ